MKRLFSRTAIAASLGLMLLNTGCTPENLTAINGLLKQAQSVSQLSADQKQDIQKGMRPDYHRPGADQGYAAAAEKPARPEDAGHKEPEYTRPVAEPTAAPSERPEEASVYAHPEAEPTVAPSERPEEAPIYTHPEPEPTAEPSEHSEEAPVYSYPEAEPTPRPEAESHDVSQPVACQSAFLKISFGQIEGEALKAWRGSATVTHGKIVLMRDRHFIPENMAMVSADGSTLKWQTNNTDIYDGLTLMVQGDGSGEMPVLTLNTELGEKVLDLEAIPFLHENYEVGESGYRLGFDGSEGADCE